jgi:acetyl-CoA carboxylase carboxyl transferase subunit alpha
VDEVVSEPLGGANTDPAAAAESLKRALVSNLDAVSKLGVRERLDQRYKKFRSFGHFTEGPQTGKAG